MWQVSLATALFGLTEPLFVPEYWNPPTLFNLAQRTGFDLESLIFCFGIGGVGSVLYFVITHRNDVPVPASEKRLPLHRHHYKALVSPFIAFALLYLLHWNPIYPSIAAMATGAIATVLCRPDLKTKTWVGGVLFLAYYFVFFLTLEVISPGYVRHPVARHPAGRTAVCLYLRPVLVRRVRAFDVAAARAGACPSLAAALACQVVAPREQRADQETGQGDVKQAERQAAPGPRPVAPEHGQVQAVRPRIDEIDRSLWEQVDRRRAYHAYNRHRQRRRAAGAPGIKSPFQ